MDYARYYIEDVYNQLLEDHYVSENKAYFVAVQNAFPLMALDDKVEPF